MAFEIYLRWVWKGLVRVDNESIIEWSGIEGFLDDD